MNQVRELTEHCLLEAGKVVVGLGDSLEMILAALFCGGHVLLEGVPGVAKTLLARTLARILGGRFARIQFTPDLMPSDVVGTTIFDLKAQNFHVRKGPVFAHVVLADEINRAPAKTQAALLEAMQENQVTIDGTSYPLPVPFVVIATQNPVEQEGTYPLPEASLDRFFFKVSIPYPAANEELEILRRHEQGLHAPERELPLVETVLTEEALLELRQKLPTVKMEESILRYVLELVRATRASKDVRLGASPRAAVVLLSGARALAAMRGRDYAVPDDVQEILPHALVHRIVLEPGAELDGLDEQGFIKRLLHLVPVPR